MQTGVTKGKSPSPFFSRDRMSKLGGRVSAGRCRCFQSQSQQKQRTGVNGHGSNCLLLRFDIPETAFLRALCAARSLFSFAVLFSFFIPCFLRVRNASPLIKPIRKERERARARERKRHQERKFFGKNKN